MHEFSRDEQSVRTLLKLENSEIKFLMYQVSINDFVNKVIMNPLEEYCFSFCRSRRVCDIKTKAIDTMNVL